ncbi:MAG: type IV pilus modification protein PilV [Magnetococcales bacterium]|nr:type IV pilus modification protein PilV [Magnetococcales bacterium]
MITRRKIRCHGFSLLEILITLLITSIGLLGLASLLSRMHVAEMEAYQRTQALILLADIAERLNVNRGTLSCFAFTTNTASGTPYIGATGTGWSLPTGCGASTSIYNTRADEAISQLNDRLQGTAEVKAGAAAGSGGMIGARACIRYDATDLLSDSVGATISGTGTYTITVTWQGLAATVAPPTASACAVGLYGSEAQRRAVSTTLRFANLTSARLDQEWPPWL